LLSWENWLEALWCKGIEAPDAAHAQ
jgi:hypothetical protein